MKVLDAINQLKPALAEIGKTVAAEYPSSVAEWQQILASINAFAAGIEKAANDEKVDKDLKSELIRQMGKSEIYSSMSAEDRVKIAELIVAKPGQTLLTREEYLKYVRSKYAKLSVENLVLYGYSKEELMRLGRINAPEGTQYQKYEEGKKLAKTMADKPSGFQELMDQALEKAAADPDLKTMFVRDYYHLDS